jgi:hypothetical protein
MNNWRPKGWVNPHAIDRRNTDHEVFESGADAMYQPAYDAGHAEGQAERDTLTLALRIGARWGGICGPRQGNTSNPCPNPELGCEECMVRWSISEAKKGA